jgi:bifunctional DNA-binding transcriptional regulator/antitoxin component of YhaV-PrlF toxin-antitoxin module
MRGVVMQHLADSYIQLTIPTDGALVLPIEQLQQIGFAPGDQLVMFVTQPGQVYLQRIEFKPPSKTVLHQQIQHAFQKNGYNNREEVINLIRDVKREIADERVTSIA